jgi:hypothetical protein
MQGSLKVQRFRVHVFNRQKAIITIIIKMTIKECLCHVNHNEAKENKESQVNSITKDGGYVVKS